MLTAIIGAEVGRVVVNQIDIAQQCDPGIRALDQVVAKQRIRGEAALQHRAHHVHLVNAFACEAAFAEQVLVDVGHGARINVETGFA